MLTTAGSLALAGAPAMRDAGLAAAIRQAGLLILGKTNLSEWANFRSSRSSSGWSARGRQCRNPHVLDRSPCGSSSGSAVAVAAGLAPLAALRDLGAVLVDPIEIATAEAMQADKSRIEKTVFLYEFKSGIAAYLAGREGGGPRTLADLIRFNQEHAAEEMPYFQQELFEEAQEKGGLQEREYLDALAEAQ